MFYYENPQNLATEPYQFDLSKMILADMSQSQHLHSTALDWVAYYHYRYNASCTRLLKFEHDILFLEPLGFDYVTMFQQDIRQHEGNTLLVYRRVCQQELINTFNIVIDKKIFMEFLDLYTLKSALNGDVMGSEEGLNGFIEAYMRITETDRFRKARIERMFMGCLEDTEETRRDTSQHWSFIHCDHTIRNDHPLCLAHYDYLESNLI
jgi:hypothetical protein